MIKNRSALLKAAPFKHMVGYKVRNNGLTHGLGEAGYDIRIRQDVRFRSALFGLLRWVEVRQDGGKWKRQLGRFTLASAIEEFKVPTNLVGIVHDKSSHARRGLSVFNTVIEPGWNGFLTLELVHHARGGLEIKAGTGIAQVIFHEIMEPNAYTGRYQNQEDKPVEAKAANDFSGASGSNVSANGSWTDIAADAFCDN